MNKHDAVTVELSAESIAFLIAIADAADEADTEEERDTIIDLTDHPLMFED